MYVIHVYNSALLSGDDGKYGNSGCSCDGAKCTDDTTQCLRDWDFLEYAAGSSCDPSCIQGCVRGSDVCDNVTCENGFTHCDLCYDRECTECSDYFSNYCLATRCSSTTLASGTGTCSCNVGAFRTDEQGPCLACHTDCGSCTTGALTNYSDCTSCLAPSFSVPITGSYFYCANYCPEGFTASVPTCTASTSPSLIYTALLNNFDGPWTNNGITATQQGMNPAKERGHYFSGTDEYASLSDFTLNFRFSILAWIRIDDLTSDQVIFSKDRDTFPDGLVFRAFTT